MEREKFIDNLKSLAKIVSKTEDYIKKSYFNTRPIISIKNQQPFVDLDFSISDVLLLAGITQSNTLLWGSSGSGKTYLAELIAGFLFGNDGYVRKNITPDMNEQDFMDIDFGAIKEGKSLKQAISADDLFSRSCLIIDEANRAPPIIQNRLLQILENNIDLKSIKVKAGEKLSDNNYYHWNILTLNYGDEYAGTSAIDRALKDRITLDIPIDNFPPTIDDQIRMIRRDVENVNGGAPLNREIFNIYKQFNDVNLSLEAEALILYLSFMSNCVKSPTGSKYGVVFSPNFCKEKNCPYARNPPLNKICPFTFATSNRVLRQLVKVAKGFSLLKKTMIYLEIANRDSEEHMITFLDKLNPEVSLKDVILVAPLVIHSKISMNSQWVLQEFNGNSFLASKFILDIVQKELYTFMNTLLKIVLKEQRGGELSEKELGIKKQTLKTDFHFEGLIKYVNKYLE